MQSNEKMQSRKKIIILVTFYALALFGICWIINLEAVNKWFTSVLLLLRPVLIGLGLAYLCNPFFRLFERKLLYKLRPMALRRTVSLILTYLTLLLIVGLLLLLILPQLLQSIADFMQNYELHLTTALGQLNHGIESVNNLFSHLTGSPTLIDPIDLTDFRSALLTWWEENSDKLLDSLSKVDIKPITEILGNAMGVVTDSLFGFFISLYLLSTKEKRYAQVMKLRRALLSNNVNQRITRLCRVADRSFGAYLEGKLVDAFIVAVLTYVCISVFRIPYAILIAAFIGVTNIVPLIGPIIGALPTSLILLLSAPGKVIPFLIIIIIIQQIDSNIISPKILGSNTGVSSLCVLIAVAAMGTLWGLWGMILAVPLFATALDLIEHTATERLQKKGLPSGLESYYAGDSVIDPAKSAHTTTDRSVQRLERDALRIEKKLALGEALTRKERLVRVTSNAAHKHHIISELSDETETRFAASAAAEACQKDAARLFDERHEAFNENKDLPAEQAPISNEAPDLPTEGTTLVSEESNEKGEA